MKRLTPHVYGGIMLFVAVETCLGSRAGADGSFYIDLRPVIVGAVLALFWLFLLAVAGLGGNE